MPIINPRLLSVGQSCDLHLCLHQQQLLMRIERIHPQMFSQDLKDGMLRGSQHIYAIQIEWETCRPLKAKDLINFRIRTVSQSKLRLQVSIIHLSRGESSVSVFGVLLLLSLQNRLRRFMRLPSSLQSELFLSTYVVAVVSSSSNVFQRADTK